MSALVHSLEGEEAVRTASAYCQLCSTHFGFGQRTYSAEFYLASRGALGNDVAPMGKEEIRAGGSVRVHFLQEKLLRVATHHLVHVSLAQQWYL